MQSLKRILEAARWSPSPLNVQPWKFVVVKSKRKISEFVDASAYGAFHTDPAVLIAVIVDPMAIHVREHAGFGVRISRRDAYISIGGAGLAIALAARAMEIDSCLLTPDQETAQRILGLMKGVEVPLVVGLGYGIKGAQARKRERKKLSELTRV